MSKVFFLQSEGKKKKMVRGGTISFLHPFLLGALFEDQLDELLLLEVALVVDMAVIQDLEKLVWMHVHQLVVSLVDGLEVAGRVVRGRGRRLGVHGLLLCA